MPIPKAAKIAPFRKVHPIRMLSQLPHCPRMLGEQTAEGQPWPGCRDSTELPWPKQCCFFLPYAPKTLHLRLGQVQRTSDEMLQTLAQQNRKHSSVHRLTRVNNVEASCLLAGGYPPITRSFPTLPPWHTATDQRRLPKPPAPTEDLKNTWKMPSLLPPHYQSA